MFAVVYLTCAFAAYAAAGYKLPDLRKPANLAVIGLIGAFTFTGSAFLFAVPTVYTHLDQALGAPNLATLLVYACIIATSAATHLMLLAWAHPHREARRRALRRLLAPAASLATMITLFNLANTHREHPTDFDITYARTPALAAFLIVYFTSFAVALGGIGRLSWRYATSAGRPWLARGLRTAALGAVFALGYCTLKIVSTGSSWLGWRWKTMNVVWAPMSASLGALLLFAGLTMPVWGPRLSALADWVGRYRAYQALRPLWRALYEAYPTIALQPHASSRRDRWNPRNLDRRLYRRLIEIRDGRLLLRTYLDRAVADTAQQLTSRAELDDVDTQAIVEASLLKAALRAKAANRPSHDRYQPTTTPGGQDLAGELAWLHRVARAFTHSPVTDAVLAAHGNSPGQPTIAERIDASRPDHP